MLHEFAFPREFPAAELVALEIKQTLDAGSGAERTPTRDNSGQKGKSSWKYKIYRRCGHMWPQFVALLDYLRGLRPNRLDVSHTFQPWRFRERRQARNAARAISRVI
jgi:hypothetical protein